MTNEERVERFKNEKIAIHCETEEEAKDFVKWSYANGFEWSCSKSTETFFEVYKDETCYGFGVGKYLGYASKKFYEEEGYKVIKYKDFVKSKNKMTNLEYVASKGLITKSYALCNTAHICKYGIDCNDKKCSECEFFNDVNLCVQTLLHDHREPIKIKLKQWEYDFMSYLSFLGYGERRLDGYDATKYLFYTKGHFKGIADTSMTLREILGNCEVIEDGEN